MTAFETKYCNRGSYRCTATTVLRSHVFSTFESSFAIPCSDVHCLTVIAAVEAERALEQAVSIPSSTFATTAGRFD
jgi:hypothetical protein